MSDTYHIPGLTPQQGHMLSCRKCGRKILVEILLTGVSHNGQVGAICGACLEVSEPFSQNHPDIARRLREWAAPAKSAQHA